MKPINLVGFNAAYQKPFSTRRRIVLESSTFGAIVAGVETKNLLIEAFIGPGSFVIQKTDAGDAYAGTCLILDQTRVSEIKNIRWVVGVEPTRGAQMLTRYILEADALVDGEWRSLRVSHGPPGRYFWLWSKWARNVRLSISRADHPVWFFADFNSRRFRVRAAFGFWARMIGVMGWALSPGEQAAKARGEQVGSDHLTVVVRRKGDDD